MDVLKEISLLGLVPVISLEDANDAVPLAKALSAGGLPVAEVTFRTEAAEESIRLIHSECPDMLVGAGTVLTCQQADRAIDAGARFIVAPGLNPEVVRHVQSRGIPMVPGVSTASEIEQALSLGLSLVKFFPAEVCGGVSAIRALGAPYRSVRFLPTGGIGPANLAEYARCDRVAACGGSWMVKSELIRQGRFEEITALCRQAVDLLLGFEFGHVGINCPDEAQADALGRWLTAGFSFDRQDNPGSAFLAGRRFELMKTPGEGAKGHIAILTNSIPRAMKHLQMRGYGFDEHTAKINDGKIGLIYFSGEYAGFRFHLSQR